MTLKWIKIQVIIHYILNLQMQPMINVPDFRSYMALTVADWLRGGVKMAYIYYWATHENSFHSFGRRCEKISVNYVMP